MTKVLGRMASLSCLAGGLLLTLWVLVLVLPSNHPNDGYVVSLPPPDANKTPDLVVTTLSANPPLEANNVEALSTDKESQTQERQLKNGNVSQKMKRRTFASSFYYGSSSSSKGMITSSKSRRTPFGGGYRFSNTKWTPRNHYSYHKNNNGVNLFTVYGRRPARRYPKMMYKKMYRMKIFKPRPMSVPRFPTTRPPPPRPTPPSIPRSTFLRLPVQVQIQLSEPLLLGPRRRRLAFTDQDLQRLDNLLTIFFNQQLPTILPDVLRLQLREQSVTVSDNRLTVTGQYVATVQVLRIGPRTLPSVNIVQVEVALLQLDYTVFEETLIDTIAAFASSTGVSLIPLLGSTPAPSPPPVPVTPTLAPVSVPMTARPTTAPVNIPSSAAPTSVPVSEPVTAIPTSMPFNVPLTDMPTSVPGSVPLTAAPTSAPFSVTMTNAPTGTTPVPTTAGPTQAPMEGPFTANPTPGIVPESTESPSFAPSLTDNTDTASPSTSPSQTPSRTDSDTPAPTTLPSDSSPGPPVSCENCSCPSGEERVRDKCYQDCPEGTIPVAEKCVYVCPAGYDDFAGICLFSQYRRTEYEVLEMCQAVEPVCESCTDIDIDYFPPCDAGFRQAPGFCDRCITDTQCPANFEDQFGIACNKPDSLPRPEGAVLPCLADCPIPVQPAFAEYAQCLKDAYSEFVDLFDFQGILDSFSGFEAIETVDDFFEGLFTLGCPANDMSLLNIPADFVKTLARCALESTSPSPITTYFGRQFEVTWGAPNLAAELILTAGAATDEFGNSACWYQLCSGGTARVLQAPDDPEDLIPQAPVTLAGNLVLGALYHPDLCKYGGPSLGAEIDTSLNIGVGGEVTFDLDFGELIIDPIIDFTESAFAVELSIQAAATPGDRTLVSLAGNLCYTLLDPRTKRICDQGGFSNAPSMSPSVSARPSQSPSVSVQPSESPTLRPSDACERQLLTFRDGNSIISGTWLRSFDGDPGVSSCKDTASFVDGNVDWEMKVRRDFFLSSVAPNCRTLTLWNIDCPEGSVIVGVFDNESEVEPEGDFRGSSGFLGPPGTRTAFKFTPQAGDSDYGVVMAEAFPTSFSSGTCQVEITINNEDGTCETLEYP